MAAKLSALAGRVGPPLGLALGAALLATVLAVAFGIVTHPFGAHACDWCRCRWRHRFCR